MHGVVVIAEKVPEAFTATLLVARMGVTKGGRMADPTQEEIKTYTERTDRLKQEVSVTMDRVTKCALTHAADHWEDDPTDPGWSADLHEDMLTTAIVECAAAINNLRVAEQARKDSLNA